MTSSSVYSKCDPSLLFVHSVTAHTTGLSPIQPLAQVCLINLQQEKGEEQTKGENSVTRLLYVMQIDGSHLCLVWLRRDTVWDQDFWGASAKCSTHQAQNILFWAVVRVTRTRGVASDPELHSRVRTTSRLFRFPNGRPTEACHQALDNEATCPWDWELRLSLTIRL